MRTAACFLNIANWPAPDGSAGHVVDHQHVPVAEITLRSRGSPAPAGSAVTRWARFGSYVAAIFTMALQVEGLAEKAQLQAWAMRLAFARSKSALPGSFATTAAKP